MDAEHHHSFGVIFEENVEIPMRDGIILRANVFRPDSDGKFPVILGRTPYGKQGGNAERYVRAGYVLVSQDSRGRYASDGDYVTFTVENTGDAEDGYDTVEWLAEQPYCNGQVGLLGASYCAWMAWMTAKTRPPHLTAMCAYTIPTELTTLDWPGAFRPGRRINWWLNTIGPDLRKKKGLAKPHTPPEAREIWENTERQHWLYTLPWTDFPKHLPRQLAKYAEKWLKDPSVEAWKLCEAHKDVDIPNLDFSGYFDHCNDTVNHLSGMQQNGRTELAREQTRLVIGPWTHCTLGAQKVGDFDFGPDARLDLTDMIIRWFDHWIKGMDNGIDQEPAVRYFVMGSNKWKSTDTWPPETNSVKTYHLDSIGIARSPEMAGVLSADLPKHDVPDSYVYDPRNPVPTLWSHNQFTLPGNRRQLEYRQDILYYRTEPLEKDLEVIGNPSVVLYASSSAPDTDFFARLVDEEPDGPALEVCYGFVRARHRNSLHKEELLSPGEIEKFTIKLGPTACCFREGHRVRLEITSSDFPNHDRNHNTGLNDLATSELAIAEQRIYHSSEYQSRLILSINA